MGYWPVQCFCVAADSLHDNLEDQQLACVKMYKLAKKHTLFGATSSVTGVAILVTLSAISSATALASFLALMTSIGVLS